MTHIAVNGVDLLTQLDGPEDGSWLVLSNSLATTNAMWDPQIDLLTQKYRVLRYDSRGHGGSSAPPAPYSFDDLTADVIGLLDHFGIAKCSFMGLSMGGMTGLGLALDHADRIERLVCCDARADAPPPFVQGWTDRIAIIREKGTSALVNGSLERWFTDAFRAGSPDAVATATAMISGTSDEGYIGCAQAISQLDYLRRLPNMTIPALYVVGKQDMGAPSEAMAAMAAATPGAEFAEIDPAGHIANWENPGDFNAAIAPFLGLT
ncbi:MAG: 3-oxoadipate enol-lactonase [Pseudomonadota bacterium]